jgi:hypothetical protein
VYSHYHGTPGRAKNSKNRNKGTVGDGTKQILIGRELGERTEEQTRQLIRIMNIF